MLYCSDVGIHHVAVHVPVWKTYTGWRRRHFLLEHAQELIMPHIRCRSLVSTLQAPIRMEMKMGSVVKQAQLTVYVIPCCLWSRDDENTFMLFVAIFKKACKKHVCYDHSTQTVVCEQCLQIQNICFCRTWWLTNNLLCWRYITL